MMNNIQSSICAVTSYHKYKDPEGKEEDDLNITIFATVQFKSSRTVVPPNSRNF